MDGESWLRDIRCGLRATRRVIVRWFVMSGLGIGKVGRATRCGFHFILIGGDSLHRLESWRIMN